MASVEKIYGMVHTGSEELYPAARSQEKCPMTAAYFSKIARFRNVDDLYCEENFFHVDERGIVTEVREEWGYQDGFEPVEPTAAYPESGEDYAWQYGRLNHGLQDDVINVYL